MRILLYGNGGAGNHGCEAIVRGTICLLGREHNTYTIHSDSVEEDGKYELQDIAEIKESRSEHAKDHRFWKAYLQMKLFHRYSYLDGLPFLNAVKESVNYADIALSVGGDNYCYSNTGFYSFLNREYNKAGMNTVLWGCSVEPDLLNDRAMITDLKNYRLITARESITFEALRKVHPNVVHIPDPAFYMPPEPIPLPEQFEMNNIIGINLSPMIISNENTEGIVYKNYQKLIQYILDNTDCSIALIPHVVWAHNDDRVVMQCIMSDFNNAPRIVLVKDHTAPQLKYIISRCRAFIGARTHATIAAYSSCVPTIVVGYSVKARGIAKDLFGEGEQYLLSAQNLRTENELKNQFVRLLEDEKTIRQHLQDKLAVYLPPGYKIENTLLQLIR